MGLVGALVDRARVVQRASTGVRIEGTTQMAELHSPWFKARLFFNAEASERAEQGERKKIVATPQLMFSVKDANGDPVHAGEPDATGTRVVGEVRLEVDSTELGLAVWRVTSDPQPIRKKRRVIGYLVTLERVVERQRAGVR